MADQSNDDATLKEIEEFLKDESFRRMYEPRNEAAACRYFKTSKEYIIQY
jgi:hypothetical protein